MRYWDNDKDRQFDEALDEMIREQSAVTYTEEDIENMYRQQNIGNPLKLIGAQ